MSHLKTIFFEESIIFDCQYLDSSLIDSVRSKGEVCSEFNFIRSNNKKLVLLVGGGMSAEREVSYMSCNGIARSLLNLGNQVIFVDMGSNIASVIEKIMPDIVYNGLHGTFGEDGSLSGVLNIMGIPYTGCGLMSSSIAMNKKFSHAFCIAHGIKVSKSITISKSDNVFADPMPRPYVIRPLSEGSSVGVEIIFEGDRFNFADYNFPYGDEVLISEYITGREMQVAILNGKALGVLEIKLLKNKRFYDYETKYTEGFAEHIFPAPISKELYKKLLIISEKVNNVFGASGMVRAEFIYNEIEDEFYFLELNTHPGMTPLSICPEIASYSGIEYTELVESVLSSAKCENSVRGKLDNQTIICQNDMV